MKTINLKWLDDLDLFKGFSEDLIEFLEPILPKTLPDLKSFYYGKDQYFFLPDFSVYVDKGADFIKDCIANMKDYFNNENGVDYSTFYSGFSDNAKEVFMPFLSNYYEPETINSLSNLSFMGMENNPFNLNDISSNFDFSSCDFLYTNINIPLDVISNVDVSGGSDLTNSPSIIETISDGIGNFLDSASDVIGDVIESTSEIIGNIASSVVDIVKDIDWSSVIGGLGGLWGF
ncbi:MAG: hypothetical protein QM751_09610 [Paludibacteraceae bacterium]